MTSPFNLRFGGVNLTSGDQGDNAEMPPETPFRFASIQERDGVRLILFQSAAQGAERLAVRW